MPRKALALTPTYGTVIENHDAYIDPMKLRQLARQHGRFWSFHSVPTTVALPGNCFAKSLAPFTDHQDEPLFQKLLSEYSDFGVPRPSGYADVFHETFRSPRVPWSVNKLLGPCLAGGWQAALEPGVHRGRYYKYDMRSAYLWAATLGMPNADTYTRSLNPFKDRRFDGVYRVKLLAPNPTAPFPFNQARECIATGLEIETYGLSVASVVDGVIWKDSIPGDKVLDAVRKVSTWKQAGRAYWGRWGQMQKVTCTARGKTWQLPNVALNVPWAHMIVSRVKMRLWEFSKRSVHVYVDSLITPSPIPTGGNLGDWRLERVYDHGVIIKGPGQYGALMDSRLEKMAGVSAVSPQRSTMAAVALL